jgi:hypothetical protein
MSCKVCTMLIILWRPMVQTASAGEEALSPDYASCKVLSSSSLVCCLSLSAHPSYGAQSTYCTCTEPLSCALYGPLTVSCTYCVIRR